MDTVLMWVLIGVCVCCFFAVCVILILLKVWGLACCKNKSNDDSNLVKERDYVLHFFDMSKAPRFIDIRSMSITDGTSLQFALAKLCDLRDPASLSLAYLNNVGCRVEVDLDRLVYPDAELKKRMISTVKRPLLLTRQDNVAQFAQTTFCELPRPQQQPRSSDVGTNFAPEWHDQQRSSRSTVSYCNNYAPPPVIFPLSSRICTTTPVIIRAVRYVVRNGGDNFSDCGGGNELDEECAAIVEEAMLGGVSRTVALPNGFNVFVDPKTSAAWLRDVNSDGRNFGLPLLREEAEVLRYTFDNTNSAQWCQYKNPIFLPPGRWCLRAESSTADHRLVETSSRVFTVDVLQRKLR